MSDGYSNELIRIVTSHVKNNSKYNVEDDDNLKKKRILPPE